MPTLCFDDSFTKMERTILQKTFKNNCQMLGIERHDATIALRRAPIGGPAHLGAITKLGTDYFVVLVNSLNDLSQSIFCLGHEMVHFHQYTRGDLIDDQDGSACYWRGHRYPRAICESRAHYDDLPWEKEAHAKQDALADSAAHCLTRDELAYVVREIDAAMARSNMAMAA